MNYLKSPDFPVHLMAYWWLTWIVLSCSPLNEFVTPSGTTIAQYLLLIAAFLAGHWTMKRLRPFDSSAPHHAFRGLQAGTLRLNLTLGVSVTACLLMLVISLRLAGAFDTDIVEYFIQMRRAFAETGEPTLTGVRVLDVLTKILAFPLTYTILVVLLSVELAAYKALFLLSLLNFVCFAYLWQVNYPFVHLFWFLVFYILLNAQRRGRFNKFILSFLAVLFVGLTASAANRFGGDLAGGFQRYIVGYHLIGFSYYDLQLQNPHSILHEHSFGRSSLGFLDQVLEALLKLLSLGYRAASFENAAFNEEAIDIGASESMEFNAFGTILYSLYRDFHLVGIVLGGFVYGAVTTAARYRSHLSWRSGALFLMLAAAWMMGMMVNPLEEAYFWFVIVTLALLGIANRGLRW